MRNSVALSLSNSVSLSPNNSVKPHTRQATRSRVLLNTNRFALRSQYLVDIVKGMLADRPDMVDLLPEDMVVPHLVDMVAHHQAEIEDMVALEERVASHQVDMEAPH